DFEAVGYGYAGSACLSYRTAHASRCGPACRERRLDDFGRNRPGVWTQCRPFMNAEDLIALNEEIAGMARAGLPLDQGLAALAREMGRGRLQRVTAGVAEDLRAGRTLPEALARQGGRVPPYYAGLVTAGIRSGRVGEVLATLTLYARSVADLRAT